ncbi:type 1 glutamine amidotransferase [Phytoactinopolyspora mesophila]|uniref:Type 1 glutamine amidotransferase n=1 Tax=Phytoactinopolyspora mesophila TaxID=2650750 RepID=A0A7K3M9H6_9ACTN|nr:type 1 glutamine amidotransferase [Phytoactinopolyspora mesophila]NDL59850.1 type 1 glutamine amidotransferase [Phytoactinopolyspora mesophila]
MSQPRVLVVQNTPAGGPRRLGDWLRDEGLTVDVVPAFDGTSVPGTLKKHDALVVLGGGYMPDDDHRAPWLAQTRSLAVQALEQGRPMLGICLGGQLLAQVAGGQVQADAGRPEHGSTQIRLRAEARDDALFRDLPTIVPAIEHHVDAITELPPGAVWLASTERCPYQAFRLGDTAWGVQFHPEVAPDRILEWDADRLRQHGFNQERLHQQAVADDHLAARTWREVTRRFAEVVNQSARG